MDRSLLLRVCHQIPRCERTEAHRSCTIERMAIKRSRRAPPSPGISSPCHTAVQSCTPVRLPPCCGTAACREVSEVSWSSEDDSTPSKLQASCTETCSGQGGREGASPGGAEADAAGSSGSLPGVSVTLLLCAASKELLGPTLLPVSSEVVGWPVNAGWQPLRPVASSPSCVEAPFSNVP